MKYQAQEDFKQYRESLINELEGGKVIEHRIVREELSNKELSKFYKYLNLEFKNNNSKNNLDNRLNSFYKINFFMIAKQKAVVIAFIWFCFNHINTVNCYFLICF